MSEGAPKKDIGAPPSYADVVASGPPAPTAGAGTSHGPLAGSSGQTQYLLHPVVDPRSQTAREAARNRAIMRFAEAFMWAILIQALAVAILGGSLWPEWRRHFVNM